MRPLPILILGALLLALPARASANTVPNWDRHFLLETAEGAHFEITMGKIAARKGHSREARAAGQVMVRDHSGELHAVQAMAKALGVKLPTAPSITQQHEIGNVPVVPAPTTTIEPTMPGMPVVAPITLPLTATAAPMAAVVTVTAVSPAPVALTSGRLIKIVSIVGTSAPRYNGR